MTYIKGLFKSLASPLGISKLAPEQEKLKDLIWQTPAVDIKQPLENIRFVVLDTETTGLKPFGDDRVLSLGATIIEQGKVIKSKRFYELVNPNREIPAEITRLTGISQQMVSTKPQLSEVLYSFINWAEGCVLVGHVINFDLYFLNNYLKKTCGMKLKYKHLDTREIAKILVPGLTNYTLEETCAYFGISCTNRHHALNDAIYSAKLLEVFIDKLLAKGISNLENLNCYLRLSQSLLPAVNM